MSDITFIIVATLSALLVGLSKGGMANMAVLSTPLLALVIAPMQAAALLLPILVISDLFALWAYRREFDKRNLAILLPAAMVGIALGWGTASLVSEHFVGLLIGLVGLAYCVNAWRVRHAVIKPKPADIPRGMFWGTVLGFASFVSHSGSPPFQVYVLPQQLPKLVFAGTSTITFAVVNAVKLLPYWQLGQLHLGNLMTSLWLMPIAVAGTFIGVRLVRVLPQKAYFGFVQLMLLLVSIKLIWDAIG